MADYSTLPALLPNNIECFVFDSLPSTNDYLANLPPSKNIQVCVTSEQTHGKGQHGHTWLSQKDSSVLFSIRRNFPADTPLAGLSLVVGLGVLEVLAKHGVHDLKLKWPNDVYFKDKKLAGILIENTLQGDAQSVVIGLGINHHIADDLACETPWTDIKQMLGFALDSSTLLTLSADLINTTFKFCNVFAQTGFQNFHSKWCEHDYLLDKKVVFNDGKSLVHGKCFGINQQGLLLVKTKYATQALSSSRALALV